MGKKALPDPFYGKFTLLIFDSIEFSLKLILQTIWKL